ncbi:agmatinase [Pararhizobium capsulatum DSM 1112]|uniref:Agmatinase n=1 Tax=Pararhizobium capsulatum DSM 1112 TaxID=1121113 RepID=A0ABU0BXV4_9HYPH|nr:arginase family protein [Pararhizobium capsulatum]MDQ0322757.1 agmatinase [Pararhizobium capsulatum DSM 1112]
MAYKLRPAMETFLGIGSGTKATAGSVVLFGAVHGTAYPNAVDIPSDVAAPDAVRRAITAASVQIDHWDFDFDGPLLNDGGFEVLDLGNVATSFGDNAGNRSAIEAVTRDIRAAGGVPILIGGDDSAAIPFMAGLGDVEALHILQIDAHIDWRDRIGDEPLGYSSTMRRASELPFVRSMTQVGIRAVGSARREEVEAARAWGSRLVTVRQVRASGVAGIADAIPRDGALLIHIDVDALDPSICPGINALSPGGLWLEEVTDLIAAGMAGRRLAGFSIVEFQPANDVNDITATVVGRLICHVLGHLARK